MKAVYGIAFLGLAMACLLCNVAMGEAAHSVTGSNLSPQGDTIQQQLHQLQEQITSLSARVEKIESLIAAAQGPQKATVRLDGALRLGNPKATIGIVEFSDYQCPFCRRFHADAFPQLEKTYINSGKVALIVRDFPLDFHPAAMRAALAVNCAGLQNVKRFWDVQDELFAHQDRLGDDLYKEIIHKFGLDQNIFEACMNDAARKKQVEDELRYAETLGVQGTPTFFVGRIDGDQLVDAVPMVGAQPYEAFVKVLEELIKDEKKPT